MTHSWNKSSIRLSLDPPLFQILLTSPPLRSIWLQAQEKMVFSFPIKNLNPIKDLRCDRSKWYLSTYYPFRTKTHPLHLITFDHQNPGSPTPSIDTKPEPSPSPPHSHLDLEPHPPLLSKTSTLTELRMSQYESQVDWEAVDEGQTSFTDDQDLFSFIDLCFGFMEIVTDFLVNEQHLGRTGNQCYWSLWVCLHSTNICASGTLPTYTLPSLSLKLISSTTSRSALNVWSSSHLSFRITIWKRLSSPSSLGLWVAYYLIKGRLYPFIISLNIAPSLHCNLIFLISFTGHVQGVCILQPLTSDIVSCRSWLSSPQKKTPMLVICQRRRQEASLKWWEIPMDTEV